MDLRTDFGTNGKVEEDTQTDGRTNDQIYGRTDVQIDGRTNG